MAIYRTGQASMDAQGYITGYGTKWREQLTLIRPGATIVFLTNPLQAGVITEVISDTSIRAITTGNAVVAKSNYLILLHDSLTVDGLAQDVAETLRYYQSKETEIESFIEIVKNFDWDRLQKLLNDVQDNAIAAAASQKAAKTSETNAAKSAKGAEDAKVAAVAAKDAANTAKTGAETAKAGAETAKTGAESAKAGADAAKKGAEVARDQAEEYARQAAKPYSDILQPLPDVWIPFNDSLDMITGFSPSYKKIVIGDDEITWPGDKIVKFKRASTATYINKSGVFTVAAIDEPRFEKDGLLIEGQRTNHIINGETPASWGRSPSITTTANTDSFGFLYGRCVIGSGDVGTNAALNMASVIAANSLDTSGDEKYVTASCRFRSDKNVRLRVRFAEGADQGSMAFAGDAYIKLSDLSVSKTGGASGRITVEVEKDEATGWNRAVVILQSTTALINAQFQISPVGNYAAGDYIDLATPQVELGIGASSYIISGVNPTTRSSDVVNIISENNLSSRPFTSLVEVHVNWGTPPNLAPRIFDVGGHGNDDNYLSLGFVSTGKIAANVGMVQPLIQPDSRHFIAGVRARDNLSVDAVCNGKYTTNTSGKVFAVSATSIRFGGQTASGVRHLFGHVRNFRIWHKALTDHQLSEIV